MKSILTKSVNKINCRTIFATINQNMRYQGDDEPFLASVVAGRGILTATHGVTVVVPDLVLAVQLVLVDAHHWRGNSHYNFIDTYPSFMRRSVSA